MYRQTLAEYLSKSLPSAEIRTVAPEDLDGEVDLFGFGLIICHEVEAMTSNLHRANEPGNVLLEVGEGN